MSDAGDQLDRSGGNGAGRAIHNMGSASDRARLGILSTISPVGRRDDHPGAWERMIGDCGFQIRISDSRGRGVRSG